MPTSRPPPRRRRRGLRQTPARTAARAPHLGRAAESRCFLAAMAPAVERDRGRRPARRVDPDGGRLISAGRREAVASFVPTTPRSRSVAAPPTATAIGTRRSSSARSTTTIRAAREEIFGPVVSVIPFRRRGGGDRPRQRDDLRALRFGLDPRRRPRAPCRPRDRQRRDLDQLEHLGAGRDPFGASSSQASAASSARCARALHRAEERLLRDRGGPMTSNRITPGGWPARSV